MSAVQLSNYVWEPEGAIPGDTPLLEVHDLSITFRQYDRGMKQKELHVITGLDISVHEGEIVAVVGSSGSGKSLLAHGIMGILPKNARMTGSITYLGAPLDEREKADLRGKEIALIPQSVNFLNPLKRVQDQLALGKKSKDTMINIQDVLRRYQLAPQDSRLFPFQLSGGMARRVLVATAAISGAKLIIADEPTPGLHEEVLKETLAHFKELAREGKGVLLITHDLEGALTIADRIAVFYAGSTVEIAPAGDFHGDGQRLRHPYSRALWQALPQNGFVPIPGHQPHPGNLPAGCLFAPRCDQATAGCKSTRPKMRMVRGGMVRCIHAS